MTDESEEAETPTDAGEPAGLQAEDVIRLSYEARTVEDEDLVDTTDEEVAAAEGIEDQGEFEPRVVVLGAGHLFETVEEDIEGKSVGDAGSVVVELPFGEYDEEEVRTVSADKIPEDDRFPGAQVQIDGEQGRLETIVGGRARVDFNHPLAGEDIRYEYEVVEEVDDTLEKARGLMEMFLDLDLEMWVQTDEVEEERMVEASDDATAATEEGGPEAEGSEEIDGDDTSAAAEGEPADVGETSDSDAEDDDSGPAFETVTEEKETLYIEATQQLTMDQGWMFQKSHIAQEIIDHTDVDRIVVQEILDGQPAGMGGMMGGMPGEEGIEEALADMDVDADEIVEEIENAEE